MIGEIIKTENTYKFKIGETVYIYKDLPLVANNFKQDGTGGGRSNFQLSGSDTPPEKQIEDLPTAFTWIAYWKNIKNLEVVCGLVLDFDSKTAYYDEEMSLLKWKEYQPDEFNFFENFKKIDNWQTATP